MNYQILKPVKSSFLCGLFKLKYYFLALVLGFLEFFIHTCFSQVAHEVVALQEPLQDKNFYLLSLLEKSDQLGNFLVKDSVLREIADQKKDCLERAGQTNNTDMQQIISELAFSPEQIHEIGLSLAKAYANNPDLQNLVSRQMRSSGFFQKDSEKNDVELLERAWEDAAHGINRILRVYGQGISPQYKQIDAISYNASSPEYNVMLLHVCEELTNIKSRRDSFFETPLRFALKLLLLNHRDEAARFEPLEKGENRASLVKIGTVNWESFPYSVILVPGIGPEDRNTRLSAEGKRHLERAVAEFKAKKAPFIIVSGGYVHPSQTQYCEALEMKRALVMDFAVPEDVILIEPFARHTTTNIRNAARLLYRYNIPFQKQLLIVSDKNQNRMILNADFTKRCVRELGYVPFSELKQVSDVEASCKPSVLSLQMDANDPLDP